MKVERDSKPLSYRFCQMKPRLHCYIAGEESQNFIEFKIADDNARYSFWFTIGIARELLTVVQF